MPDVRLPTGPVPELKRVRLLNIYRYDNESPDSRARRVPAEASMQRRYKDLLGKAEVASEERLEHQIAALRGIRAPHEDLENVKLHAGRVGREADRLLAVHGANRLAERMVELGCAEWADAG